MLDDRGFDIIADNLCVYGANLVKLCFTRRKKQLSLENVEHSKKVAKVRIHVERVIDNMLKSKYTILQGTLPLCSLKHRGDSESAFIDKIVTVFAGLVNLSPPIVPMFILISL